MEVSSVSFAGRLAQTKKGNTYEKTNTGKRIGTVVGLLGGGAFTASGLGALTAALLASRVAKGNKIIAATYGIMAAFVAAATLIGRGLGAIPDAIINHSRKSKADNKNAVDTQA